MWPHQNRILSQPALQPADQAAILTTNPSDMKSALPMVPSSANSSALNSSSLYYMGHKRTSQRQPPLLTNSEFGGKYVILEPLEASSLYMCIDKETLQEFVCKVVPTRSYHDYLSGYLRMDGNPGVNTIEAVFVGPKQSYVLFLPSHGDLHSYVRCRKRLPEAEAISLFHQIVSIVNDCHQNGICLRDLKLRKFVFRDPERTQIKLETLDDAVVLEDPQDDLLGEKHGCPVYCSPEILSSVSGRYSGRGADCWSLGVILYTMIVGRYPFHDPNPTHLFGKICRGLFHIPPSISPLIRCVINSLLRKDPSERMTAQDLLDCQLFSPKYMQALDRNPVNLLLL